MMKSILTVGLVLAGLSNIAHADCGKLSGQVTETDTSSSITRIITRFETSTGPKYTYEIVFGRNVAPEGNQLGAYPVNATLNGKTSVDKGVRFLLGGNTGVPATVDAGGSLASGGCGDEGINTNTITPHLFSNAACGDQLNAWHGSLQAGNTLVRFNFPQENLNELSWTN